MKQQVINSFGGGINKDLNQLSTPADVLTDCLNGTIITHNGNEFSLQNDMGNAKIGTAFLRDGYIPVGMKEYGGIIYVAAYNPETNKGQVGCFPSPQQLYTNTNKITNYSINLDQFYIDKNEVSDRYSIEAPIIGQSNIREIVQVDNEEVVLYPGDKFIFSAKLDDTTLQAIKDRVLTINLALLTPSGSLEYINQNTLNTYEYKINKNQNNKVSHWILDTERLDVDVDLDILLSDKNEDNRQYVQVLKSNSSGKLVVIANLNTVENTNYLIQYIKESEKNYGMKITPEIVLNKNTALNDFGLIYKINGTDSGITEKNNPIEKTQEFNDDSVLSIQSAPYTKYGVVDKFYQEFSLSWNDIQSPEDDLKVFKYYVLENQIEIQLSYTYIDFFNTQVTNTLYIYNSNSDGENAIIEYSIDNLNGTQIIKIPYDDNFRKGSLYICELKRNYIYSNNYTDEKSIYNYLYMTPLFNGVNIIGADQLTIDDIPDVSYAYDNLNSVSLSSNINLGTQSSADKNKDYLFTCNYEHIIRIENEGSFNVPYVTINGVEYDWNTYFIGNGELKFTAEDITYNDITCNTNVKSNSNNSSWIDNIKSELNSNIPKFTSQDLDQYKQLTLKYPFIVDYEIGKLQNQISHGWSPFLTQNNVSGIKSPFTFDYFESEQEKRYGPGTEGQLVAAIVQQHEGLAKHIISKNKDNIPKYKNSEKNTWEDVPRDKANKYYPNLYYTFDEEKTQESFTELMNLAKDGQDHKTIGIITGGWGDYASLGFSLSLYEQYTGMFTYRAYRKDNKGYAWYDGIWDGFPEFDANDNWMFACMQELDKYDEPGDWKFLNLGSKRYEDNNYLCVDELLKQLFSQLYVYKSSVTQIEDSEIYYTKPLPEFISENRPTSDAIPITVKFKLKKSPFDLLSNINNFWKDKAIHNYLPKYSKDNFEEVVNIKYSEIYNKVYNYINVNKDNQIVQEEQEALLNKDKIYIANIDGATYDNGIFTQVKFDLDSETTTSQQNKCIQFKLNGELCDGMSWKQLNEHFVYKDENIYLRRPRNPYDYTYLVFTKGQPSEGQETMQMNIKSICDGLRFLYKEQH